jgi:hypothetical protein
MMDDLFDDSDSNSDSVLGDGDGKDDSDCESNHSIDFDEQCEDDNLSTESWQFRFRNTKEFDHLTSNYACRNRTNRTQAAESDTKKLLDNVGSVLDYMKSKGLDLALFLYTVSGHDPKFRTRRMGNERCALLQHPDIIDTLTGLELHADRNCATHPVNPVRQYAMDCVRRQANKEMQAVKPLMRMGARDVSLEAFTNINIKDLVTNTRNITPCLWQMLTWFSQTNRQHSRNVRKTPSGLVFWTICCMMAFRSPSHGALVKMITLHMRSCYLGARGFDTGHAFGFLTSQKWIYGALDHLLEAAQTALRQAVKDHEIVINPDNINLSFKVNEQRLHNQDHFDSGCLITIYSLHQPNAVKPSLLRQCSWCQGQCIVPHLIRSSHGVILLGLD